MNGKYLKISYNLSLKIYVFNIAIVCICIEINCSQVMSPYQCFEGEMFFLIPDAVRYLVP